MWFLFRLLLGALRTATRSRQDLILENVVLRHQLAVYRRSRRRLPLTNRDRQLWSTIARSWTGWRGAVIFVHSDTVVRWHRTAWRRHWARKSRCRGPGRPRLDRDTQDLIRQMARENPRWGAIRIVGAVGVQNSVPLEFSSRLPFTDEVLPWGCKTPSVPSDQIGKIHGLIFVPHRTKFCTPTPFACRFQVSTAWQTPPPVARWTRKSRETRESIDTWARRSAYVPRVGHDAR
jgi:hypothetical protein